MGAETHTEQSARIHRQEEYNLHFSIVFFSGPEIFIFSTAGVKFSVTAVKSRPTSSQVLLYIFLVLRDQ